MSDLDMFSDGDVDGMDCPTCAMSIQYCICWHEDPFQNSHNRDVSEPLESIGSPSQVPTGVGVDSWNTYTPVNYQGPLTNGYSAELYITSTSPDSTVHAASAVGSPGSSWVQHNLLQTPTSREEHGRTVCRDFIEMGPSIYLEGDPVAIGNLLHFVGDNLNRQFTSSTGQLCALYALETSLRSMFPQQSPTFDDLQAIWASQEYSDLATRQTEIIGIESMRQELFATSNLSVQVILLILRLLGPMMNRVFDLGICEMARAETTNVNGAPVQTFIAYCLSSSDNEPSNATIWLHNDRYEETGMGMSHWSGFGIDLQAHSGILAPRIVLSNADHARISSHTSQSDINQYPLLTSCPLAFSHSATDSAYSTSDTPYSANSRMGSLEPSTGGFNSSLSPSSYHVELLASLPRITEVVQARSPALPYKTLRNATFAMQSSSERASGNTARDTRTYAARKIKNTHAKFAQSASNIPRIYAATMNRSTLAYVHGSVLSSNVTTSIMASLEKTIFEGIQRHVTQVLKSEPQSLHMTTILNTPPTDQTY
ncbi:hypothetical protein EG328_002595 [Venturia inaequalis]|uniref:Uncharacterized protein n=1 Tax=Venturia inaequalis TaxID=5025 RepID=A0A8H3YWN1_VENIN|nr:hypothetical protein EG328_002595 [Venturia inaequalis]